MLLDDQDKAPKHAKAAEPQTEPTPKASDAGASDSKGSKTALKVLFVVLVCGVIAGCTYMGWQIFEQQRALDQQMSQEAPEVTDNMEDSSQVVLADNPIDFNQLQEENPDVFGWIYIPQTNINLPILKSSVDDLFYMNHNRYGEYAVEGAVFIQSMNSTSMTDPVTVIYGHNMNNGGIFATLHYFENEDFFAENQDMYIYIRNHILKYQIISAYQYDDKHIMNSYDFTNSDVRQSYFDYVLNPSSLVVNVREGASLNQDSKIVQLSTCANESYNANKRYLVTGVLVEDTPTV